MAAGLRILTAQGRALHGIVMKKERVPAECLSHGKGKQPDGEGKNERNFFTASLFFPGDVPVHSPDCRKMTSDSPERRPDKPCVWCGLLREKMKAYNKKMQEIRLRVRRIPSCSSGFDCRKHPRGSSSLFSAIRQRMFYQHHFRTPVQEHRLLRTKSQSHEYYPYYR